VEVGDARKEASVDAPTDCERHDLSWHGSIEWLPIRSVGCVDRTVFGVDRLCHEVKGSRPRSSRGKRVKAEGLCKVACSLKWGYAGSHLSFTFHP
jgi:hypothetical protein